MEPLNVIEKARYGRQMLMPGWGEENQLKLKASSVMIAGAGGLGSPAALYLAAAGIGELRICDSDTVDLSNLNRQILHNEARVGSLKALSAYSSLQALNSSIQVQVFSRRLEANNIEEIIGGADIVLDCLDNFETRYLLNTYCIQRRIPLVHAAVWGFTGQLTFLLPPETPCLRCLVPQPPERGTFPVVGAAPGVIGSLQALEALKFLTGIGSNLKGSLLLFDGEDSCFTPLKISRDSKCPGCSGLS
jgi:adenylyltransferase/sulfurtransferase